MRATALQEFATYGSKPADMNWEYLLEMRSRGQGFELLCAIEPDRLHAEGPAYLARLFRDTHVARYGTAPANDHIELVTYQLVANVPGSRGVLDRLSPPRSANAPTPETGAIRFRHDRSTCPFAWREDLPQGWRQKGLAVIEEPTATTMVPPGWTATVGALGALELTKEKA
jgi:N-methylhydantoinase A